mgnify:FL=1
MKPHAMARGFLKGVAILLLLAFWAIVLGRPRGPRPSLPEPSSIAGLRPSMSCREAARRLEEWGTPFEVLPAVAIDRPAGAPASFATVRLGAGPSPFGPLRQGSLRFVDDALAWVELEIDLRGDAANAAQAASREDRLLGPATARRLSSACWRFEAMGALAWRTVAGGLRRLSIAFPDAASRAGLPGAEDPAAMRAAIEAEIEEALGRPLPED